MNDLQQYERKVYSQNGEDGVLARIFEVIGAPHRYCVEFGCGTGRICNTRLLRTNGWGGLMMDLIGRQRKFATIHQERITVENIESLFNKYSVPAKFDLLSIDIDGNDYWVWQAISNYRPRVVVAEYNASVPPDIAATIPYDPEFSWPRTTFFGASLLALAQLGKRKRYTLVYCDNHGVNAFFIANECLPAGYARQQVATLYKPPNYKGGGRGHRPETERYMINPNTGEPVWPSPATTKSSP
jgi:hypothetical protein